MYKDRRLAHEEMRHEKCPHLRMCKKNKGAVNRNREINKEAIGYL